MRPVNPEMLRRLPRLRRHLFAVGALALATAATIVVQAAALSAALASTVLEGPGAIPSGAVLAFALTVGVRGLL
ncbi:MAG: hypothetical protein ACRDXX_14445, partial [Stackebrandtia sp.]